MEEPSECTKVCYVCGDRGFFNLLVYCSECFDHAAHKYCLGIIPGSIDDIDGVYWACEDCCPSMESELTTCEMPDESAIVLLEDQPEPLQTLLPMLCHGSSQQVEISNQSLFAEGTPRTFMNVCDEAQISPLMENPEAIVSGLVLLVSPSREITSNQDMSFCDDGSPQQAEISSQSHFTEGTPRTLMDVCDEAPISALMENPEAISSGLVLLASPSGEIMSNQDGGFCENEHFCSLDATVLSLTCEANDNISDMLVKQISPYMVKPNSGPNLDITGYKDREAEHDCRAEETVELDPGSDQDTDACPSETVELDIGTDEEFDACYPSEPACTVISKDRPEFFSDRVVDESGQNVEHKAPQVNEASAAGSDQDTDACPSETVELDTGSDEEFDACYPSEPACTDISKDQPEFFSDRVVDESGQNVEHKAPQVNEASAADIFRLSVLQPVPMKYQHDPLMISEKPPEELHESEDSTTPSSDVSRCKPTLLEPIEVSKLSKTSDASEFSIPASALKMGGEFLESSLEMIDIQVGGYNIRSDLASILRNVLDNYGDVFKECDIKPESLLVNVCEVIQYLQRVPFKCLQSQHVAYLRDSLRIPEALGVDVKWLSNHCDYLEKVALKIRQYPELKRELARSIASVQAKEKILSCKRGDSPKLQEEIMGLVGELKSSKERVKKLQYSIQEIVSLCKRSFGRTLADGLF